MRFYSQKQLTAISSPLTPWQKRNREVMEKLQGIANYYNKVGKGSKDLTDTSVITTQNITNGKYFVTVK